MSFPRTHGIPLSNGRITKFRNEAKDTFHRSCVSRLLLAPINPISKADFRKFGLNNIVDRIWFVDGNFEEGYATPSGAPYGSAVAEVETRHVLEMVLELVRQNTAEYVIETISDPTENEVCSLLSMLRERQFEPTVMIGSTEQSLRFWDFANFVPTREVRRGLMSSEGSFNGVPVHHSRLLPDGTILVVDMNALGILEVKEDFDIWVSDISNEEERNRIRQDVPSLSTANLDEKARILGYEIVKASIREKAFALIAAGGNRIQLKKYDQSI